MARQSREKPRAEPVPVLLTRPEGQARAFAADLALRFGDRLRPVMSPLMAMQPLRPARPEGAFSGVIFTSTAGIDAAHPLHWDLPRMAWCVGQATARHAAQVGFDARSAEGDADALVAAILADPPTGRLLYLRGEDTRGEVAERLSSAGIETVSVTIYRQAAQPLTPEAVSLLQAPGPVIAPLFSPRSAGLLKTAAPAIAADFHLVVMSYAVAAEARLIPHKTLHIASRPDAAAMLDAVAQALSRTTLP